MEPAVLALLRCPETRQKLSPAEPQVVQRIVRETLKDRAGNAVTELEGALVREDGKVAYPIRNGIPVLIVDEGIFVFPP